MNDQKAARYRLALTGEHRALKRVPTGSPGERGAETRKTNDEGAEDGQLTVEELEERIAPAPSTSPTVGPLHLVGPNT